MASVAWFCVEMDEADLIAYLARSGTLWAFAWHVDPTKPEYPAAPIVEFLRDHGAALEAGYRTTSEGWAAENTAYWADPTVTRPNREDWGEPRNVVHIGLRDAVIAPRIHEFERLEGGVIEPTELPGAGRIVGGTNVKRRTLASTNDLMSYDRAIWMPHHDAHHGASLSCKGATIERIAKQTVAWIRRRTPHEVQVADANVTRRATQRAADEAARGVRFC